MARYYYANRAIVTPDSRSLYRHHEKACPHKKDGRAYQKCQCPIWVDFSYAGKRLWKSLKTRDWPVAERSLHSSESSDVANRKETTPPVGTPKSESRLLEAVCAAFLADAKERELRDTTLYKYRLLLRRLQAFSKARGFQLVTDLKLENLREFRAAWPHHNTAARRRIEELRTFFGFCLDSGWITTNPAKDLKPPPHMGAPVEPFGDDEIKQIRSACVSSPGKAGPANMRRLEALVELMLFTGLRIQDAVTLRRDRIVGGNICLRTEKTGTPVNLPLPRSLIEKLDGVRSASPDYFFWSGSSKPKSAVGNWQRSLKRLFESAGIVNGHAHRFRHTFAKLLFMKGTPAEDVAALMGHRSSSVTLKHYASWGKDRQKQLESYIKRIWDEDDRPEEPPKTLKPPESVIQPLYGNRRQWLN
jgi:integrase/recombinase XerD